MASPVESHLLSLIESSATGDVFSSFSDYLRSFSDVTNPKKSRSVAKQKQDEALTIRSLAKQFLPFINKSLSLLPKRLSNLKEAKGTDEIARDLIETFRLCLDCLELVSSQLSCKPYTVQLQRVRLIYCLEAWGWYGDAEIEGFRVLEKLRGADPGMKKQNRNGKHLPGEDNASKEYAMVVVEVVAAIVRCTAMAQVKDREKCRVVLELLEEARSWLRVLDENAYEKMQRVLVTYLAKIALSLVREAVNFDRNLVCAFIVMTVKEYMKSSLKEQIYKFARQIFSALFALKSTETSIVVDIAMSVLRTMSCDFQVETSDSGPQLVDLVSYCAIKCRAAGSICCSTVSEHLSDIAVKCSQVMPPFDLILRLYTIGLSISICGIKFEESEATSSKGTQTNTVLIADGDEWQNLDSALGSLECFFYGARKQNCVSCPVTLIRSMSKVKKAYLLPYVESLKFLCQPLADLINMEKRHIVSETKVASVPVHLVVIQDVFHQFCSGCLFLQRSLSDGERVGIDYGKIMVNVAMAGFILSIRTQLNMKISSHLVKEVITSRWIQPQELKYMFASLYNVGVVLYRNKQFIEASKALKLCYKVSWTLVGLLCRMFKNQPDSSHEDLSEEAIIDFVSEACSRCELFLDVLQQCGNLNYEKFIVDILENWSTTGNLIERLPAPMPIIKQWVKIEYKLLKSSLAESCTTLYSLLSSSQKFTNWTMGKLLEQELLAYEEMRALCPNLSLRMQVEIISILLNDVYITEDTCLSRARALIWRARATRMIGSEHLRDCVKCLTEAISIMDGMHHQQNFPDLSSHHQLAVAYCLRALCIQESDPNSKQVFQDISASLTLWVRNLVPNDSHEDAQATTQENMIPLLYTIIDLLSMKGTTELHHDLYMFVLKIFKSKNVQLETCIGLLWECRRLNHALCPSPINVVFISNLSEYCGEKFNFTDFWSRLLEVSKAQLIGFQQNFFFLYSNSLHSSANHENIFQSDVSIEDVKLVASELSSSVPMPSRSAFLAGRLYYDLSERLISNGRFSEALSCAKEAHRLRTLIFQEKFKYCVEKQPEKYNDTGGVRAMKSYGLKDFQVLKSIATEAWPCGNAKWDMTSYFLSPWNVLQCYLESTLQVGIVSELIGNGADAETFLSWGKTISCYQSLLPFMVSFSLALGNLYRKKRLWDLAEKELQNANQLLRDSEMGFSCSKCRLTLEATLNKQLGELSRSCSVTASTDSQAEGLFLAIGHFKAALDKLNSSVWRNTVICRVGENGDGLVVENECLRSFQINASRVACSVESQSDKTVLSTKEGLTTKRGNIKGRKPKNAPKVSSKEQNLVYDGLRLTRSKCRSSKEQSLSNAPDKKIGVLKKESGVNVPSSSNSCCEGDTGSTNLIPHICICDRSQCWQCLCKEVMESGLLDSFICLKWEFYRRRLSSWILLSLGKCLADYGELYQAHDAILRSIVALFNKDPFSKSYPPASLLLDFITKEYVGDVFAVERAAILYTICRLTLKNYHPERARINCCDLSLISFPKVVSCLLLTFVLSREVPMLFQKVSRLLAALSLLSVVNVDFSLPFSCKELSESHWASYFHQASLSTHISNQFFSILGDNNKAKGILETKGTNVTGLPCRGADELVIPSRRLAPECTEDLPMFVKDFYRNLPSSTVICINVLGGAFARLLEELAHTPSHVSAWLLLSRLNSKSQPVILLLPVDSLEEDDLNSTTSEIAERKDLDVPWHCPWGSAVVDDVAPAFRLILEENYVSSFDISVEDTKRNRSIWWTTRKKLDHHLDKLLRNMEDTWLGPWRHVLLGELSDDKHLDAVHKKLVKDLKSKCKVDVNDTLLKVILGGGMEGIEEEACIAQLCLRNGCYVGSLGYYDEDGCKTPTKRSTGVENLHGLALRLIHEAVTKIEQKDDVTRLPIILVLDPEVQMLPWESMPILRKQEVYRMPSVGSISATLNGCQPHEEQVGSHVASFPWIDPLDAFYLLNPGGDLNNTQVEFESWFKDQNLEGKAGLVPTSQELAQALRSHDLFLYFGHGSGAQYISKHDIENLEKCAATFLMGCSSGSLFLNGSYIPQGIPLSYLLAGSPVIVANLWEVTDKDIDRFGKAMLQSWLKERSESTEGCTECSSITTELAAMNLKVNTRKKSVRKKPVETSTNVGCSCKTESNRRRKIGSFMGEAREACNLPFLIGAAPVCYGLPTGIRRKKDL